jgi:hypothetical protein
MPGCELEYYIEQENETYTVSTLYVCSEILTPFSITYTWICSILCALSFWVAMAVLGSSGEKCIFPEHEDQNCKDCGVFNVIGSFFYVLSWIFFSSKDLLVCCQPSQTDAIIITALFQGFLVFGILLILISYVILFQQIPKRRVL